MSVDEFFMNQRSDVESSNNNLDNVDESRQSSSAVEIVHGKRPLLEQELPLKIDNPPLNREVEVIELDSD